MLNQILALTWKDLKIFFKDRGHVVLIFLQPSMFIVLMSYALSGVFSSSGDRPIRLLGVNEDRGKQAGAVLRQLGEMKSFQVETEWEGQPITREKAERLIAGKKRNMALIFPADFSSVNPPWELNVKFKLRPSMLYIRIGNKYLTYGIRKTNRYRLR